MITLDELGADRAQMLFSFADIANGLGSKIYLVGGCVRDLILQESVADLDVLVDANLWSFLDLLESKWGELFPSESSPKNIVRYEKYFTAKIQFNSEFRGHSALDFSQARGETYPVAGGPPKAFASSLSDDIRRRDFTINSIALEIFGRTTSLVDQSGGVEDLKTKVLRVHHDRSFIDDPIRLVRAVRFMVRFGLNLSEDTKKLFDFGVGEKLLETVPLKRRFDELKKVLAEKKIIEIGDALGKAGLLGSLAPYVDPAKIKRLLPGASFEQNLKNILRKDIDLTSTFNEIQIAKDLKKELLK